MTKPGPKPGSVRPWNRGRQDQHLVVVYCLWCGESVKGRSTRRYCDGLCRWHAWAARHKAD